MSLHGSVLFGVAAGQIDLLMVSPGGSLLYELMRVRRLRMGYGQELGGASLFAACDPAKRDAVAKEV